MSILTNLFKPQASYPSSAGTAGSELYAWLTDGLSSAGVHLNERTIMCISAVYASVNLIGGAIASLPLPIYGRTEEGRERVEHNLWWLLNEQPNPMISAAVFWEYMIASLLLQGDAFAKIKRGRGLRAHEITGFEPVHPAFVYVTREGDRLVYVIYTDAEKPQVVDQDDILHVPGPGFDGFQSGVFGGNRYRGRSQIQHVLRNAAGIALAADEYSASFFKNGARPDFAIEMPGNPSPEQQDMIRRTWVERHGGVNKKHLPALMVGGAKVHELTMNAEDAQLIATRQFQIEDIARIFGVPPFMIGHTEKTTSWGSGVEQMGIGFVKYTLQRHLAKIEQEINRKCFRTDRYFAEFNTAGLERGDFKSRNEGYRIALGRAGEPGWMVVNEVRKLENLPPVPDGDKLNGGNDEASASQAAE